VKVPVKIYFPRALYDQISETAKQNGEKFSDTVIRLIETALKGGKKKGKT